MSQFGSEKKSITEMLHEWSKGKRGAVDDLMPLVYAELHRQAHNYMRRERRDHTLQTTALINEAYLKLFDQPDMDWESRTHFFAYAAQAMRQVLVDHARTKKRKKRGGEDAIRITLEDEMAVEVNGKTIDLIALDEALTRLGEIDSRQVKLVELRFFSGLTLKESAETLHISRATAARDWSFAKAWLKRELTR